MGELLAKLVDKLWGSLRRFWHWSYAVWVFPVAIGVAALTAVSDWGRTQPNTAQWVAVVVAVLVAWWSWVGTHKVPQAQRGRIGVVVSVIAEDDGQQQQVASDFIASMRQLFAVDAAESKLELIVLPKWLGEKCTDPDAALQVLASCRGHFLLYGTARKRTLGGASSHLLSMQGLVRHAVISKDAQAALSEDFSAALPSSIHFAVDNDAFAFEATSVATALAAQYVIGLAAMVSGDYAYAERLLLAVESRLNQRRGAGELSAHVASTLPKRLNRLYFDWLNGLYELYFLRREKRTVELAAPLADKLLRRDPGNEDALLWKAICQFVLGRDVKAAIATVTRCKRSNDATWRYSLAFLYAYQGKMREAREEYGYAFQSKRVGPNVPVQSEEFIQLVLAEEPEKGQLHFAAGLINLEAKEDPLSALRDFKAFLAHPDAQRYPQEVALAKQHIEDISNGGGEG